MTEEPRKPWSLMTVDEKLEAWRADVIALAGLASGGGQSDLHCRFCLGAGYLEALALGGIEQMREREAPKKVARRAKSAPAGGVE